MCGIGGAVSLRGAAVAGLGRVLDVMDELQRHRGPDGSGQWMSGEGHVGLMHRRLAVIDTGAAGHQPMHGAGGTVITFNGEIYNYRELTSELKHRWQFRSASDTERILAAYGERGTDCLDSLRGMFAFAIWDANRRQLFCARDRFGIKPFYYCVVDGVFYFASEAKALVPLLPEVKTDESALAEYLTFQYTIGEKTLFSGIRQLLPGHALLVRNGEVTVWRYWDVHYEIDFDHSPAYFYGQLQERLSEAVALNLRSDVEVGCYLSGGIDSSLVYAMAAGSGEVRKGFHGRFRGLEGFDESRHAHSVTAAAGGELHCLDITADDFRQNIEDIVYHLDFPVAGPGSFPQFMTSRLASSQLKVVLGGQGGDEMFGGYARYLVAYLEQCLRAAIDGTYRNGSYVVTIESIVPNLGLLREYKPLMKQFWSEGLFDPMDSRYFRLIDRSTDLTNEVDRDVLQRERVYADFCQVFNNSRNVQKEAYFDRMTHFDFKCLLPALLQVEDRMSMAHGIESRVPLLDHPLVEFAATVPADVKFRDGTMKHMLKHAFADMLPGSVLERRDKMGFPVPLVDWFRGELRDYVMDVFSDMAGKHRPYFNADAIRKNLDGEAAFSRKTWGLLSLELWHQRFHDRGAHYRQMLKAGQ